MVYAMLKKKACAVRIVCGISLLVAAVCISNLYALHKDASLKFVMIEVLKQNIPERKASLCKEGNKFKNGIANMYPKIAKVYVPPNTEPPKPACVDLLEGNDDAKHQAKSYMDFYPPSLQSVDRILNDLADCDAFIRTRSYPQQPGSLEEKDFPIAYSILIHTDIGQAERLLRNIYQPQNHYCFHVDAKADSRISTIILALSKCLPNVFLVSKQVSIVYASMKRLQAELNCLKDLSSRRTMRKWKYFINLTGQAFPLRTNLELVKILQIYNGANDIEGLLAKSEYMSSRWKFEWKVLRGKLSKTTTPKEPPPNGIRLVKGSAYGAFSREFIEFALTDKLSKDFLAWCEYTYSPDEFYWATLHHVFVNPMFHSPGGFGGAAERKPWLASYSAWGPRDRCGGKFIRGVCIFGVGDLPNLRSRRELFANKFYWNFEYLALDCLEEWLRNKTRHNLPLDIFYYKQLPFIQR